MSSPGLNALLARRGGTLLVSAGLEHSFSGEARRLPDSKGGEGGKHSSSGVSIMSKPPRRFLIASHSMWRWPKERIPNSLRSPKCRCWRNWPEMSLTLNFFTTASSNPAFLIQPHTWCTDQVSRGVPVDGAGSKAGPARLGDSIGDHSRNNSSSGVDCCEYRKRCGPVGPWIALLGSAFSCDEGRPKLKPRKSFDAGVRSSS